MHTLALFQFCCDNNNVIHCFINTMNLHSDFFEIHLLFCYNKTHLLYSKLKVHVNDFSAYVDIKYKYKLCVFMYDNTFVFIKNMLRMY